MCYSEPGWGPGAECGERHDRQGLDQRRGPAAGEGSCPPSLGHPQEVGRELLAFLPLLLCQRWEVIASFVNDHSKEDSRPKTAKQVAQYTLSPSPPLSLCVCVCVCVQVINKVKSLQRLEAAQRDSESAFLAFQQTSNFRTPTVEATPTERYGTNHNFLWVYSCNL